MKENILVIGSSGQIGSSLVLELRNLYGDNNVIASDIRPSSKKIMNSGPFEYLDVLDNKSLISLIKKYNITQVYLLAALLSANAEKNIELGWKLNMTSHSNVLELARKKLIKKLFWPSSIAVFGPNTPKIETPQHTITDPNTVYGITKQAGERWNEYYFNRFGVDVRSLRYPGIIGWESSAGGGTTDYAVEIFHQAILKQKYECFLSEDTKLPMMYMKDAVRSTIEIMEAPSDQIKIRSSYNLSGVSFSPKDLAQEIQKHIPDFKITYIPDFRQKIADSWPSSINDDKAKQDWNWELKYTLSEIVSEMISNLKLQYKTKHHAK